MSVEVFDLLKVHVDQFILVVLGLKIIEYVTACQAV
jgi:hypothetical protein